MSSSDKAQEPQVVTQFTKVELASYLEDIEAKILDSNASYMHLMLALNQILRSKNIEQVMDEELTQRARDLWTKLKTCGFQLNDPPLLFGNYSEFIDHPENGSPQVHRTSDGVSQ